MQIALFVTCLTDTFEPRAGVAVVRLLRHFGCEVLFPENQTCCGQPAYNNGFHDEAAAQGRRMIDVFERDDRYRECDYVVTPSGSCATMVIEHIPELLADDPDYAEPAQRLASRTKEFTTFLTDVLKVDPASLSVGTKQSVTYHYSCHHRLIQSPEDASHMIGKIAGDGYRELDPLDQCCGFGGAFSVLYPRISVAMVDDKVASIERTGAQVVACTETGCSMTIGGAAHQRGKPVDFKHVSEIMAEQLGLMDD